jgi:hypothetical protein
MLPIGVNNRLETPELGDAVKSLADNNLGAQEVIDSRGPIR